MKVIRHAFSVAVSLAGISVSPVKVYQVMADLTAGFDLHFLYPLIVAVTVLDLAVLFLLYSKEFGSQIRTIAGLPRIRQGWPCGPVRPYYPYRYGCGRGAAVSGK